MLLSSITLSAQSRAAARPGIAANPETPDETADRRAGELSNPILLTLALALVLAATVDGVGPWALLLLFLNAPLVRLLRPWERGRIQPTAASAATSDPPADGIDDDGTP